MKCTSCGSDYSLGEDFCPHCGAAILDENRHPRLGHYRLISEIGQGGMGIVYAAVDEKLGREVAIKILHPHLLKHENLKDRFRREARMHAKILHPNIVTLLSLYEDESHMALVMEMVHGDNLRNFLRKHPIPDLSDVLRISDAILSGLDAAHKLGVVHRDLKPANVLLANDGSIKLMDFGLAKPKQDKDEDITQSGATVGSFRYMAPEQITNQPLDMRTDLYSFGILLYQMCTGRLPFDASSNGGGEFQIMEKQVREAPVPPQKFNPNLPPMLANLILDLLAKDKNERPPNCEAVRKILLQVSKHQALAEVMHEKARIPPPDEEQSNVEIAKGLISAMVHHLMRPFRQKNTLPAGKNRVLDSRRKAWRMPLIWSGVLLLLLASGWALSTVMQTGSQAINDKSSVLSETERVGPSSPKSQPTITEPVALASNPDVPATNEQRNDMPSASISKQKTVDASVTTTASRPKKALNAVTTKVAKSDRTRKQPRRSPVEKTVTSKLSGIAYQVKRSDRSKVDPKGRHEFNGGSRVYFADMKQYKWKSFLRTYKKGSVELLTKHPIQVSRIVLHKASVGDKDFKYGYVRLEVRSASNNKWAELFQQKNEDVDKPVSLNIPAKIGKINAVRLSFKSAEPITIGPIDLL